MTITSIVDNYESDKRREEITKLVALVEPQIELEYVSDQATLLQFASDRVADAAPRISGLLGVEVGERELRLPIWQLVDWLRIVSRIQ